MDRSELIQSLLSESQESVLRGNVIWSIKDDRLLCHEMFHTKGIGWRAKTYTEKDLPPHNSCPKSLLAKATNDVHPEWRDIILNYRETHRQWKKHIKEVFASKKRTEVVRIHLEAKPGFKIPKECRLLNLEIIDHDSLYGRAVNDRLYIVPAKMIKKIEILKKKGNELYFAVPDSGTQDEESAKQ